MPKDVIMPALGLAQETGRVLQWLKADGDLVTPGELLVEIETDKATLELEAEASGFLMSISAQPGDEVPVGTTIAKIWAEDEMKNGSSGAIASALGSDSTAATSDKAGVREPETEASLAPTRRTHPAANIAESNSLPRGESRLPSSPKARRLAAEQGIDLGSLSAPAGRPVLAEDLLRAGTGEALPREKPEMNRTWRIMAERMTEAWTSIPHFYLAREVDATQLIKLKQSSQPPTDFKVTISDILVQKAANCLRNHPRLCTLWQNGGPHASTDISVGLAVAIDEGLIVPVIHRADRMSLLEIAQTRAEIVRRAQTRKLRPDDLTGGIFTISNLGMYGVDSFQAIINPPQAAILAVGRIVERVLAVNGNFTIRPVMTLTLSCDHRLVDGLRGAKFLLDLVSDLERPQ